MNYIILLSIFLCFGLNTLAQEETADQDENETEIIFTSQDKDYLQLWHYEQVLQMKLGPAGHDNYLSLLNYYTYKMSRLGLAKYNYTDAERKNKFDELVTKLNADMNLYLLNSSGFSNSDSTNQLGINEGIIAFNKFY